MSIFSNRSSSKSAFEVPLERTLAEPLGVAVRGHHLWVHFDGARKIDFGDHLELAIEFHLELEPPSHNANLEHLIEHGIGHGTVAELMRDRNQYTRFGFAFSSLVSMPANLRNLERFVKKVARSYRTQG